MFQLYLYQLKIMQKYLKKTNNWNDQKDQINI